MMPSVCDRLSDPGSENAKIIGFESNDETVQIIAKSVINPGDRSGIRLNTQCMNHVAGTLTLTSVRVPTAWFAVSAPRGADGAQSGSCIEEEEEDEDHRSAAARLIRARHQSINQSISQVIGHT